MILYHGTTLQNLQGILEHGLIAGKGNSLHRTKTRSMLFLTPDFTGAFLYASPGCYDSFYASSTPAVLEVVLTDMSKLEPDYDDLSQEEIVDQLEEIAKNINIDLINLPINMRLNEDVFQRASDYIDGTKMFTSVPWIIEADDKEKVLYIEPTVFQHIDLPGVDPEYLDDGIVQWDDSGQTGLWIRQYRYRGQIPTADIKAVWSPKEVAPSIGRSKWMKIYACWEEGEMEPQKVNMVRNLVW